MLWRLGIASRIVLLIYGELQDRVAPVKYTDIDYNVFTDAAAYVTQGLSPYLRSTYRYSPLLAWTLVPNVLLHPAWGKTLFCAADLLAAWLIKDLLLAKRVPANHMNLSVVCWLFNPFTITISTRGNGEALVAVQILVMLRCLTHGQVKLAGMLLGIAMHWRVYPVIYSLPILLWLPSATISTPSQYQTTASRLLRAASWERVQFAMAAATTFLGLGTACYAAYGTAFLNETYLYHSRRKDPRHNFSIYFYSTYLMYHCQDNVSWLAPITQLVSTAAIGIKYAQQLPFCMMLQTMAFVAFNKVCTAQYFVWWLTLLPLVLPDVDLIAIIWPSMLWVLSQLHWLLWAYLLEFQGKAVHLQVWCASILMLAANIHLMSRFIGCTRPVPFCYAAKSTKLHMK